MSVENEEKRCRGKYERNWEIEEKSLKKRAQDRRRSSLWDEITDWSTSTVLCFFSNYRHRFSWFTISVISPACEAFHLPRLRRHLSRPSVLFPTIRFLFFSFLFLSASPFSSHTHTHSRVSTLVFFINLARCEYRTLYLEEEEQFLFTVLYLLAFLLFYPSICDGNIFLLIECNRVKKEGRKKMHWPSAT